MIWLYTNLRFFNLQRRALILLTFFIGLPLLVNWVDQAERYFFGVAPGVTMAEQDFSRMLPEEVIAAVEYLAQKHQKLPREPYLDKENGQIVKEAPGVIIDVAGSVQMILNAAPGQ
ncbi:MAG: hypothetical protein AB7D05_11280, partial [Mangrovibacterium sp.]